MSWKTIGKSVIGTSHISADKQCEDALQFKIILDNKEEQVLIAIASDGAGSAKFAKEASVLVTSLGMNLIANWIKDDKEINEATIILLVETLLDELTKQSDLTTEPLCEYSCTLLGCVSHNTSSVFFQIGDGAIIRDDGNDGYTTVWWPQNGEYANTTSFITDDNALSNLRITILDEPVNEVALITDGLQMLALNNETSTVHQPFFNGLFKWLRFAQKQDEIEILNNKLEEYLSGDVINNRTDDDKTLFLGTRKQ